MGEDRRQEDQHIAHVVRTTAAQQSSLRKDGDTWPEYLVRVVTPERLGILAILVFQFGGQFQQFTTDVRDLKLAKATVEEQLKASRETLDKTHETLMLQAATLNRLESQTTRLTTENEKTQGLSLRLTDQIRGAVTRSEFNAAINQGILPRLDRIETLVK